MRIYVPHPYTAIDAVELSTTEAAPECQHCRQQKYKIIRNPDFLNDMFIHTSKAEFTDRLGTDHLTCRGGYGFLFRSEFFFQATRELEYLFFFPKFNIRLYDKNSESDNFFSSTKIRIFFSATLGIRIFF